MSTVPLLCCPSVQPYKNIRTDSERVFSDFIAFAISDTSLTSKPDILEIKAGEHVFQLVKQINFGPLESKRYFVHSHELDGYIELSERDIIDQGLQKLNSFKNFKCTGHNRFFEINIYERDPKNAHHWRADVARPASEIDL